jgi:ABC-type antimicrobial peptide transport system permease subunit
VPSSTKARTAGGSENSQANNQATNAVQITSLKYRDVEDVKTLPNVKNGYGVAMAQLISSYKDVSKNAFIFGSDSSRFEIESTVIEYGRPYTREEDRSLAQVAILGSKIAEDFFGLDNPIGKFIRIGSYNFEVVGVYESKRNASFMNEDEQIYVPLSTLQKKILGIDYLFYAVLELEDNNKDDVTALAIADLLRNNHNISDPLKDDFKVTTQEENLATFETILSVIKILLIAIASISLIVGGVGVMNIMYVAVTERVSEIGLKKAIGATNKNILYEFVTEAIMLTLIGGIVGILFGAVLTLATTLVANNFGLTWKFIIPASGIVSSLLVSMAIGLVFGVFPAKNASKLNPIEALNKE